MERITIKRIWDRKPQIIEKFEPLLQLALQPDQDKYILGINGYADDLLDTFQKINMPITGIIDDYTNEKFYRGLPIVRTESVPKHALTISCVLDGKLITAIDRLRRSGITNVLTYFELYLRYPELIKPVRFCENNVRDIERNRQKYEWLHSVLEDELSRQTLVHLTDFRYNFDVDAMRFFPYRLQHQYFDVFPRGSREIFADCGGYDGTTTRTFISLYPDYKKVFYFEPSAEQFAASKQALSQHPRIKFYNLAVFNENTTLMFNSNLGSSSFISSEGNEAVKAARLDDIISEQVTFLKLDVEGAEYAALSGAEQLIRTYKPKIAVCVYHDQSDFWRIPELLLHYNPEYKVYLRHYTEGLLETVMYFA